MRASYAELLRNADNPNDWEQPRTFAWAAEMARVRALRPKLERIVGHDLEVDDQVQDAAFFAELSWRTEARYQSGVGNVVFSYVAIRFSAFGGLCTVWGNAPDRPLPSELVSLLASALEAEGYAYVPMEELEAPYVGSHRFAEQIPSWWARFFDYT